jgi:CheY-like chemotaxis protein
MQVEMDAPTILLAEDEAQVRKLVERLLRMQGYAVLTTTNGREAVEASRGCTGPIDLLLTDVVMPEMGGREAAAIIRGERPSIRVIFMSGYSEDLVRRELTAPFLSKPFTPAQLREIVTAELAMR